MTFDDARFPRDQSSIDGGLNTKTDGISQKTFICNCNLKPVRRQVFKDGPNQGRYYLSCPNRTCNYFNWDSSSSHISTNKAVIWKRYDAQKGWKIIPPNNNYHVDHILQGGLGDCWLLSALAVIATRRDLIQAIIYNTDEYSSHGKVTFRLFIDGDWQFIDVDDWLPCKDNEKKRKHFSSSSTDTGNNNYQLAFAKQYQNYIWVPLLEKAYAKAHGCYHAISGGYIKEALLDLTGCPCETIHFHSLSFDSEFTWIRLLSFYEAGYPMGCATYMTVEGLVGCHAYSILEVKELFDFHSLINTSGTTANMNMEMTQSKVYEYFDREIVLLSDTSDETNKLKRQEEMYEKLNRITSINGSLRMIRLRNPWGKREWTGDFSSKCTLWTKTLEQVLNKGKMNDGIFWMPYTDFLMYFDFVDVCKAPRINNAISTATATATATATTISGSSSSSSRNSMSSYLSTTDKTTMSFSSSKPCQHDNNNMICMTSLLNSQSYQSTYAQSFHDQFYPLSTTHLYSYTPSLFIPYFLTASSFYMTVLEPSWLFLTIIQKTKRGRFRSYEDINYWYSSLSLLLFQQYTTEKSIKLHSNSHSSDSDTCNIDMNSTSTQYHLLQMSMCGPCRDTTPMEVQLPPGQYRIVILYTPLLPSSRRVYTNTNSSSVNKSSSSSCSMSSSSASSKQTQILNPNSMKKESYVLRITSSKPVIVETITNLPNVTYDKSLPIMYYPYFSQLCHSIYDKLRQYILQKSSIILSTVTGPYRNQYDEILNTSSSSSGSGSGDKWYIQEALSLSIDYTTLRGVQNKAITRSFKSSSETYADSIAIEDSKKGTNSIHIDNSEIETKVVKNVISSSDIIDLTDENDEEEIQLVSHHDNNVYPHLSTTSSSSDIYTFNQTPCTLNNQPLTTNDKIRIYYMTQDQGLNFLILQNTSSHHLSFNIILQVKNYLISPNPYIMKTCLHHTMVDTVGSIKAKIKQREKDNISVIDESELSIEEIQAIIASMEDTHNINAITFQDILSEQTVIPSSELDIISLPETNSNHSSSTTNITVTPHYQYEKAAYQEIYIHCILPSFHQCILAVISEGQYNHTGNTMNNNHILYQHHEFKITIPCLRYFSTTSVTDDISQGQCNKTSIPKYKSAELHTCSIYMPTPIL